MDDGLLSFNNEDEARLVGGEIDQVAVSLRVIGDDLDPDEISRLLGMTPTYAARRGEKRVTKHRALEQPVGVWSFDIGKSSEWVLEDLVRSLLDRLRVSPDVWQSIRSRYRVELFCGLFLRNWNRGTELSSELLAAVAERGITLSLDIYCNCTDSDA